MPRLISFSKTKRPIQEGTKDITRRLGWDFLEPAVQLWPVHKCMGFQKGDGPIRLREKPIVVTDTRKELLNSLLSYKLPITSYHTHHPDLLFYSEAEAWNDVEREGFPGKSPEWFVTMFCELNKCEQDTLVNRIVFRYQDMHVKFVDRKNLPAVPRDVAVCPICDAGLIIEDIDEWESETGRVTYCGLHVACSKAPEIDSKGWLEWFKWHYNMPYVDWLPVDDVVYRWFNKHYRYDDGGSDEA